MGVARAWVAHTRWTLEEENVLRQHYATASLDDLEAMLPGRHRRMIQCKANGLGLVRIKQPKRTPEQVREAKRLHMAKKRLADVQSARAYGRSYHQKNKEKVNAKRREDHVRRLFWSRALKLRGIKAKHLASLWKKQRGLCALTGQKMDRTAQIDHKIPQARGGTHALENLQWVTAEANLAKRDLTDDEFHALCELVVRWTGKRLQFREAA